MKKRYADGGVTEGENKNIDDDTRMRARAAVARRMAGEDSGSSGADTNTFGEAFRSARSSGDKTFMWRGKKYTTELKADSKPGPSGRPRDNVAPSGRGAAPGSFADDKAHMEDLMRPGRDAIENVYPEQLVGGPGGVGLKALAGLASKLANRGTGRALALRGAEETPVTFLGASGARNITPKPRIGETARPRLEGPRPRLEGPPPKQLGSSTKPMTAAEREAAKRQAEEDAYDAMRASDMEAGFKKGGKVKAYAKGGSVRGDGCAQRGKTKGRFI